MATDRWKRIAELFDMAIECAPESRDELLHRECGDDHALRQEVSRLIRNDLRAPIDFLLSDSGESFDSAICSDSEIDSLIGQRVGPFLVSSVIAKGGMGVVYLAEQQNPKREVALKILYSGIGLRSAERRFAFETEVLGRLHHPYIAQVYDAGLAKVSDSLGKALPYFAMEHVPNAKPVNKYCDDCHLDMRARLRMFVHVCNAIHHGHQHGVIHRDLKPANILVDDAGHPKVIDFGIARSTNSDLSKTTIHTESGQILGTLAYMSPEQCAADPACLDTTTDVYSLGIVLYQLLTRHLPYDVANLPIHATTRVICEAEPKKPSAFTPKLKGDMDTIVLKAIRKKKVDRYGSVEALAADIRRFLDGERVEARPPTRLSRFVRMVVRRPILATTVVCVSIALMVWMGTTLSIDYYLRQPDTLEIDKAGRFVALLNRKGTPIHEWPSKESQRPGVVDCALLLDRPTDTGGGRIAVIGFTARLEGPFSGKFCAFSIDGETPLDDPEWSPRFALPDIPAGLRSMDPPDSQLFAEGATVLEVFDDLPGQELILTFRWGDTSKRLIRIYDLEGKPHYQVWHDGGRSHFRRLRDADKIICVAMDEKVKSALLPVTQIPNPRGFAVFAWRPTRSRMMHQFIQELEHGDPDHPAWYKYFSPPATDVLDYNVRFADLWDPNERKNYVGVELNFVVPVKADVVIKIDADGNEAVDKRDWNDAFGQFEDHGMLPVLDLIELRDSLPTDRDIWQRK